jgi:uncharacterized OB-fold protein
MSKEYRTIRNDVSLPYRWSLGPVWTRFFDGLKNEKIFGTKCTQCNKVLIPARPFCPDCFGKMTEWIEVGQEGLVTSWTLVKNRYYGQIKEPPYIMALIQLDGTDCGFSHFIDGIDMTDVENVREKLAVGTRVKAKWNQDKNATIYDIAHFEPVS